MRIGAHMSAAGGVYKAFERAEEVGCETMLVFTKSNRQWKAKPLAEQDIAAYQAAAAQYENITPVAVHASYLINIASPDPQLWEKSYQALKIEVERAGALGIPFITFHPGSYMKSDLQTGISSIARGVKRLLAETAVTAPHTTICLETMAGQGTNIGFKFEQLATIINETEPTGTEDTGTEDTGTENTGTEATGRLGVCFDTCHVFAAGYDLRTPEAYAATMDEFERVVGLDAIKVFHFNDSKFDLGQRKDRHAHIGQGFIGKQGFANFLNDPRWANHAAHLETPKKEKDDDGNEIEMDGVNMGTLRELRDA